MKEKFRCFNFTYRGESFKIWASKSYLIYMEKRMRKHMTSLEEVISKRKYRCKLDLIAEQN